MNLLQEIAKVRKDVAEACLIAARELEAGRAATPFQEKLHRLASGHAHPIRIAIIATRGELLQPFLTEMLGQDYNVCKVVVPARLGFSEITLQERGFLIDDGAGPREFEDAGSFLRAIEQTHALQHANGEAEASGTVRVKLQAPPHLSGLCLLVPHSLEALVRKPALLSSLADQTDWVFLVGQPGSEFSPAQRAAIQLLLDHVIGMQGIQCPGEAEGGATSGGWWKDWRVGLSLGLVRMGSELLRSRIALLTTPESELRRYLVEARLQRQLEMTLALMGEELQQGQRQITNRLALSREGLSAGGAPSDLRKATDSIRARLAEELDSITKSAEREARSAAAADGPVHQRLRQAAQSVSSADIEQLEGAGSIKLSLSEEARARLGQLLLSLAHERFQADRLQLQEGFDCSLRDAEAGLERTLGTRTKLDADLPDTEALWQNIAHLAKPEIRYRGEMPKPTLLSRLGAARQGIMSLMIIGAVLGGVATLTGEQGSGQGVRTTLYSLMLPLIVIGFLWTYVSFRKREAEVLEKEVEKLQDGVQAEVRRVWQELQREQHQALGSAFQKALRSVQQQIDRALEHAERTRQREADEGRRRGQEQQRSMDQRLTRLRQLSQEAAGHQSKVAEGRKLQAQWVADWIQRFNKNPA